MSRTTSLEFSSDDESFPSLDFLASKRSPSKTVSPAKKASTSNSADKENAPMQPPRTLKSRRHVDMDPSTPGSMLKPTPLRRRKLGNSQAVDESLFQKWGEIEPLRKEKKERLASNPRSLRLKPSNLALSSHEATEVSLDVTNLDLTKLDLSMSESDDTIVRRKRSPRKVSGNKTPARKRPVTVFDESSEEEEEEEEEEEQDEESSSSSSEEESSIEASKVSRDEKAASDGEESDFVTALSLDTDCTESSSSEFEVEIKPAAKPSPAKKQTLNKTKKKAISSRSSPDESASDSESAPHTPPRKTSRRADDKKPSADDLDDAFKKLKIFSEENGDDEEETKKKKLQLDPVTPRKVLLPSPTKGKAIPTSPWKPEHSEFWDPEVQNKWIDDHSPHKQPSPRKLALDGGDVNTKAALKLKYGTSPEKKNAKKAFDAAKEAVAERFLAELDEKVTDGQLAKLTAATGGIAIKWSTTLQSTAGRAHWKCKETTTMTEQPDGSMASGGKQRLHTAHIELATKVLLNEADLLNTVAHEFCHLATFILDGKPKAAHGAEFKRWGARCSRAFGGRGIVVTTKHNYEIEYKYIWRCVECLTEVQRHSKSVDPAKHRCGRCKGVLQQVKPVPRGSGGGAAAAKGKTGGGESSVLGGGEKKEKKVSAYQEFTGRQMKALKAENKGMTFKEMMAIVSSRWKAHQAALKEAAAAGAGTGAASPAEEEAKKVTQITETMQEMSVVD
ncbi:SprT-like family-domain-containing protein [Apiospora marii]|uniref:SprT-like family-domain-containing protein n=1 Tax=Apiospora marii TaxID=335849 RepID=A0ABR1RKL5_9PEZI